MATFNQRDGQQLYIGAAATKTTGGIGTLNAGEIGLFTPAGTRLTEASAATANEFIIVRAQDGSVDNPNIMSGVIKKANIISATRRVYAADTQQVTNIGYDGASGSIVTANNTLYHVRINLRQSMTSNHGGLYVKHGIYETDSSAAQWEIAQGIADSLIRNFSKEADVPMLAERLCDEAGAAMTGTGTLAVTNGSKYVLAGTDVDAVLVVGDFVRIGGTATTDPVYQVVALDTTNEIATLDVAYQGATATVAEAATEVITNANGIAAEWGVKLTGQTKRFVTGKIHNSVTKWTTTLENFGTTALTEAVGTEGTGTANQVKELEFFVQGNEGDYLRMGEPNIYPSRALASGNYDLIDIVTEEIYTGSISSGPIRMVYTVALPETAPNYAIAGTADDITDVLEVLANGSADGSLAVT